MLRTKIVCTIGPASRDPATLAALIRARMDVARLTRSVSHGDPEFHRENIRRIRQLAEELEKPVVLDAKQGVICKRPQAPAHVEE
jgi:pyruvate kinase